MARFVLINDRVFSIKSKTRLDIAASLSLDDLLICSHVSERPLPDPDLRHGTMDPPNSYVRIEKVTSTVPIIMD